MSGTEEDGEVGPVSGACGVLEEIGDEGGLVGFVVAADDEDFLAIALV